MTIERLTVLLAALVLAAAPLPARATIQADQLCWEPDIEFPVPCDSDED